MSDQLSAQRLPPARKGLTWVLALGSLVLLAAVLVFLFVTGGGLAELAGPPVEQLSVGNVRIVGPEMVEVSVVNDGPETLTIAQVRVDDAYWAFEADPSNTLPRFGRAVLRIPYPWVEEETHVISMVTGTGVVFEAEIPVAVESPRPSASLFGRFGLVGLYVGLVPVLLGVLWYPLMRKMGRRAMDFVLSLTVGLLLFLAIGTWLDALEFARELPVFWQGVPMVVLVALLSLGILQGVSRPRGGGSSDPLVLAYMIALGIGLHNMGEGLAIGAAYALGEAALGKFLVLGFTLHNITEGVGVAAPLVKKNPGLKHFALLVLLAGGPAVLGMWIGGFAFSPVLATVFLAVGLGAILQVIWQVGLLVIRERRKPGEAALNLVTGGGVLAGVLFMYFTAFLVKF
jgi:zinc transporter ZupT